MFDPSWSDTPRRTCRDVAAPQEYVENEAAGRALKPLVDLVDPHGPDAITTAIGAVSPKIRHTIGVVDAELRCAR
jgi:hypothetical protein